MSDRKDGPNKPWVENEDIDARFLRKAREGSNFPNPANYTVPASLLVMCVVMICIAGALLPTMAESVFLGYFLGANSVFGMFMSTGTGEDYRWPMSALYGLLAHSGVSAGTQSTLGYVGGISGALLVALVWGALFVGMHSLMRRIAYGRGKEGRMIRYLLATLLWNSVFALSALIPGYFAFNSSVKGDVFFGGSGPGLTPYMLSYIVFLLVLWRQHHLNKTLVA